MRVLSRKSEINAVASVLLTDAVNTCCVRLLLDSANTVSSSMSSVGYRHDNPAVTEQRVAQILNEARAAMKAVEAPQRTKVYYFSSYSLVWHGGFVVRPSDLQLRGLRFESRLFCST